jgi:exosortase
VTDTESEPTEERALAAPGGPTEHEHEHEHEPGGGWWARLSGERTLAVAVVSLVVVWAYGPVLRSLLDSWEHDPNYSHGYLVVPVALAIWWQRRHMPNVFATPPWQWGWLLLAIVLGARAFFYERGNLWAESITLLPALGCLVLTFGGWGLFQKAWPALAFLIFMIPLPARLNTILAQPLQTMATTASVALLKLSGLWVIAEGNVILVGKQPLEVAEACNGLSMLMCLAATVMATILLVPLSKGMRVVMVLSAVPIAMLSNVLRIAVTAWCYQRFGFQVGHRVAHDMAGWLMMPTALVLVGLELLILAWLFVEETSVTEPMLLGKPITSSKDRDRRGIDGPGRTGPAALPPGEPGA